MCRMIAYMMRNDTIVIGQERTYTVYMLMKDLYMYIRRYLIPFFGCLMCLTASAASWQDYVPSRYHLYGGVSGFCAGMVRIAATRHAARGIKGGITWFFTPQDNLPHQDNVHKMTIPREQVDRDLRTCPIARNMYGILTVPTTLACESLAYRYILRNMYPEHQDAFRVGWRLGALASSLLHCYILSNTEHPRFRGETISIGLQCCFEYSYTSGWHVSTSGV